MAEKFRKKRWPKQGVPHGLCDGPAGTATVDEKLKKPNRAHLKLADEFQQQKLVDDLSGRNPNGRSDDDKQGEATRLLQEERGERKQDCSSSSCNIGCWNVRTLRKGKLENVKVEARNYNMDVLGMSEVRWKEEGDFRSDEFRMIHSGSKNGQGGVAVLLRGKWSEAVCQVEVKSERLMMVKLNTEPRQMIIIQVYMPTLSSETKKWTDCVMI